MNELEDLKDTHMKEYINLKISVKYYATSAESSEDIVHFILGQRWKF
jgi:hypothetical protein